MNSIVVNIVIVRIMISEKLMIARHQFVIWVAIGQELGGEVRVQELEMESGIVR